MALRVPWLLRRLRPRSPTSSLASAGAPCPAVLTSRISRSSATLRSMGRRETRSSASSSRAPARRGPARARDLARRRTIVELYGLPPEKVVVTLLAPDPRSARRRARRLRAVGRRGRGAKEPAACADAARAAGRRLVVVGPERDPGLVARATCARSGRSWLREKESSPGSTARLPRCSSRRGTRVSAFRRGGDGEGTPVVATPDAAVREVGATPSRTRPRAVRRDARARPGRPCAVDDRRLERAATLSWPRRRAGRSPSTVRYWHERSPPS